MNGYSLQTIHEVGPSPSHLIPPNKIIINVGGMRFETYKSTLKNIPDTRLAWITESKADNPDYDPVSGEYFFDRHPLIFLMILNYYRTGKLHTPSDVCGPAFEEELAFWGIDEKQIESCCWGGYSQHRDAQHTLEELRIDTNDNDDLDPEDREFGSTAEKFGIMESDEHGQHVWERLKPKIWAVLNGQSASRVAKAFTAISIMFTITVITAFILETHELCRIPRNASEVVQHIPFSEYREKTQPHPVLFYIEIVCMIELTMETVARLITCPVKKIFFKNALNVFDLISLLSFYVTLTLILIDDTYRESPIVGLQFIRLARVLRIFKVAALLPALKILFHTLRASAMELLLMLMLIISLMVCFASIIYYAEQVQEAEDNNFTSIPIGFWWAIVTMTTLGYGDKHPQTAVGYVVGSICAICGVLFIALPIPIIVNNFSIYYTHAKAQEKLPKKKKVALVGAADALKQTMQELIMIPAAAASSSDTPAFESTSRESSPYQNEHEQNCRADSKDTINDSGGTNSTDRTTKGINVIFTDVDETDDMHESSPKPTNGTVICNGHNALPAGRRYNTEVEVDINDRLITGSSPGNLKSKRSLQAPAVSRRASLLPGGVSNGPSPASPKGLSVKSGGARERRRSLMPASYAGG